MQGLHPVLLITAELFYPLYTPLPFPAVAGNAYLPASYYMLIHNDRP